MADEQMLEGPQIFEREKELLNNICTKVGCVFAQAGLGICKAKYEGDVYGDFDLSAQGNCETACIPVGDNKNIVRPARVWKDGRIEILANEIGEVFNMENPANYIYELKPTTNKITGERMGIARFMGIRK